MRRRRAEPDAGRVVEKAARDRAADVLVEVQGATVEFGRRRVLDSVDLAVHRGEIVSLIGPNGSGKTTLVRLVLGLLAPAAGSVVRGPGLRLGYVPQHVHVDPTLPLNVGRFLALGGGVEPARVEQALREVGCLSLADAPFQTLSGGEARRVALARAMLREPDLLVLDEPAAGVDVTGQAELYELIQALRDRRRPGVLIVSHDLHLVMAATDRVVCLNHHICCAGRPDAVSRHPEYLALFGTGLQDRLAVYRHRHDHRHDLGGEVKLAEPPGHDRRA